MKYENELIFPVNHESGIIQMDITGLNDLDLVYHHLANNKITVLTYKMSDQEEKTKVNNQLTNVCTFARTSLGRISDTIVTIDPGYRKEKI